MKHEQKTKEQGEPRQSEIAVMAGQSRVTITFSVFPPPMLSAAQVHSTLSYFTKSEERPFSSTRRFARMNQRNFLRAAKR